MKQLSLFLSLFIVIHVHAQMQTGTVTQNLIDVSTKSPDVASLGKFGNIPVSYATGVPSINIPVYEINVGKIKLPISLDYHAGGIRVSEMSSSVGLGWALSGFGVVSRQAVGNPDEDANNGLFLMPPPDSVFIYPNIYYQYLFNVQRGWADNEPDQFSYTINGQSGKFTFRRDRSIMQSPVSNNKIVYTTAGALGDIFTITDQNGVLYIFDLKVNNATSFASSTKNITAAWRLTKMVDANSTDTIYFSYETACNPIYQKNYNYSHYLGREKYCGLTETFISEERMTYQLATLNEAYPKEIRWRGGKISFINTCDRADVSGSAMRLTEVDVYANQEGTLKQVKRVALYHSYFYSNSTGYAFDNAPVDQKKRLRLDSVGLLPVSGTIPPQIYRMTYDTTLMAPRESCAQDRWGFNNGAFGNYSLLPPQSIYWVDAYHDIGSGNRQPDSTYMKACSITSIQYPTKGKTVFDLESHAFNLFEMQTEPHYSQVSCYGGVQSTDTALFTVTTADVNFKYRFSISAFATASPAPSPRPRIILTDLTSGADVVSTSTPTGGENASYSRENIELTLIAGHSYRFIINTNTTSSSVSAFATIDWTKNLGQSYVRKIGGGLRIKALTNYDENGKIVSKERYEYGGGTMLTSMYFQDMNVEKVIPRSALSDPQNCYYWTTSYPPGYALIFHANGLLPASQCNGSPLLYSNVTRYQVDSVGNANGKSEYGYKIFEDQSAALQDLTTYGDLVFNGRGPVINSYDWKNNILSYENTYRSTTSGYQKLNSKAYDYQPLRDTTAYRIKIKVRHLTTCCLENNISDAQAILDFYITPYDQPTGVMLLNSESDTTWDDFGNKIYTVQQYEYNDATHTYPTLTRSFTSTGDTISVLSKYPHDLAAAGNVYQKMMTRNIVSPLVQQVKKKNSVQLSLTNINYTDVNSNSKLLLPQTIDEQISNYPIETKLRFNKFDLYGNIQEQQKDSDIRQSYVWGYDTLYPIATVTNAAQNEIAHTSFEPDAAGYWTIPSTTRDITQGITGRQSYALSNGSVSRTGLTTTKSYVVSYWSKTASATVNGSTATSSYNKNGWYYYEHTIATGASTITVSGSVTIDELRLYPTDAQMNTFTYDPQVGMTTQCDADNRISYFEYDGFNRLKLVRDMDRNVFKTYEYRYKQ